jgi:hypothetical protein
MDKELSGAQDCRTVQKDKTYPEGSSYYVPGYPERFGK